MSKIEQAFYNVGLLDKLSRQDSPVHRLDPRAKLLTTAVFIVIVISFNKYEIAQLLPFFLYPVLLVMLAGLPPAYFLKKIIILSPFVLFVGAFNPFLDREIIFQAGPLAISGGWISFISILLRFSLTVSAALILIATSGFSNVCMALEQLGAPRIFAMQLLFLYRYLFVLTEDGIRMIRARALRSFNGRGLGLRVFRQLLGNLLLRTMDRAQRVHMAMLCRGFTGEIRSSRRLQSGWPETVFVLAACAFFIIMRLYNLPELIGFAILELRG